MAGTTSGLLPVLWYQLEPYGLGPPDAATYSLATQVFVNAIFAVGEYLVLRFVAGSTSGGVRAWIPATVLVALAQYFVATSWLRIAFTNFVDVEALVALAGSALITGAVQGYLLSEMLHVRRAMLVWPLASVLVEFAAVPLAVLGMLDWVGDSFVAAAAADALIGILYGAISGAFLVYLVRRSRLGATTPAASIQAEQGEWIAP